MYNIQTLHAAPGSTAAVHLMKQDTKSIDITALQQATWEVRNYAYSAKSQILQRWHILHMPEGLVCIETTALAGRIMTSQASILQCSDAWQRFRGTLHFSRAPDSITIPAIPRRLVSLTRTKGELH